MSDELDLEHGDPSKGSPEDERAARRRRRRERSSDSGSSKASGVEAEIRSRLDRVFDRLAKNRHAADDEELATVLEEDAEQMAQGFISLTNNVPFLAMPLIMALNILEPILAFGRVGRILAVRFFMRRAQRQAEWEQAQAEAEAANNGGGTEVPVA